MHKNVQKDERKTRSKFPATTTSCSMVKIGRLDDSFLEVFLIASKPSKRSTTAAKRKEKAKTGRGKNSKIEKPNDVGHLLVQKLSKFKILISAHA